MVCEFTLVYLYLHEDFLAIQDIKYEVRFIFNEHMKYTLSFCLLISGVRKILMLAFPGKLYFAQIYSIYYSNLISCFIYLILEK